jgi:hypothetical protein
MQLTIAESTHTFIPLQAFRSQWGLPDNFNLAHFEPKEWQGLGSLDGSGKALATVRQRVIEAVPPTVTLAGLISQVEGLINLFQRELAVINSQIGLRDVEVDFAVAGFADVTQAVGYHLMQLGHIHRHDPSQISSNFDFSAIYQSWLDTSVRISTTTHLYAHENVQYEVQIVYNAYGRVGLKVLVADEVYYVADMALACPASAYMMDLCEEVAQALCLALTRSISNV